MGILNRIILCCLPLALVGSVPQETTLVPDQPRCDQCRLTLTREALLGWDDDVELCLGRLRRTFVVRPPSGRWIVGPTCDRWEVVVFGPNGELLRRLGQSGQGPGEIEEVVNLWVDPAGWIHVLDRDGTVHAYSTSFQHEVAESRNPLNVSQPVAVLGDGATVQNVVRVGPRGDALPLHVVSPQQEILASFGNEEGQYRYDRPQDYIRWIAVWNAKIWAAHFMDYRIDRWTREGNLEATLVRRAPWFRGQTGREDEGYSLVASLRLDEEGRLWVLGSAPEGTHEPRGVVRNGGSPCSEASSSRDAFIEIIDPSSGELVARFTMDRPFDSWVGDRLIHNCLPSEGEGEALAVWRPELETSQ